MFSSDPTSSRHDSTLLRAGHSMSAAARTDNAVHASTQAGSQAEASGSEKLRTIVVTATAIDTWRIPS
jgi:hypothetical protein